MRLYIILMMLLLGGSIISVSCREDRNLDMVPLRLQGRPFEFIDVLITGYRETDYYNFQIRIDGSDTKVCHVDGGENWAFQVPDIAPGVYSLELYGTSKKAIYTGTFEVLPIPVENGWLPNYSVKTKINCYTAIYPGMPNDTSSCIVVESVIADFLYTMGYYFDRKKQQLYVTCYGDTTHCPIADFTLQPGDTLKNCIINPDYWLTVTFRSDNKIIFINSEGSESEYRKGIGCIKCIWLY